MPSPIAHSAMFLLVKPVVGPAAISALNRKRLWLFCLFTLVALNVPDIDFLLIYLGLVESHGMATHSLVTAVIFSIIFAVLCRWLLGNCLSYIWLAAIMFGCYVSHLVMDVFTYGRGVLLLWPVFNSRIHSPVPLFYGAHHSELSAWNKHLVTLATELAFAVLVYFIASRISKCRKVRQVVDKD